jgi:hypothetical protein
MKTLSQIGNQLYLYQLPYKKERLIISITIDCSIVGDQIVV